MLEKDIEKKLIIKAKSHHGMCLKFTSPSLIGIPDRIVLLPKGKVGFVEVKQLGKVPRPIQTKRIKQLRALGFKVFILDDKKGIDEILGKIGGDA